MSLWKRIKYATAMSTKGMSRDEWLAHRQKGIGGSDAGAIMGMNKYKSALTVYFEKKGQSVFEGNAATERGQRLEPIVRKWTAETLPTEGDKTAELEACPAMFQSNEYPYMLANLDGLINLKTNKLTLNGQTVTGLGGHEIKTSKRGDGFGDSEIPDSYYCQVQHYMAVTGLDWFALTVYILDADELKHYIVTRNEDFILRLIKAEGDFWHNNIQADTPPQAQGLESESDIVDKLLNGKAGEVTLDDATAEFVAKERALNAQIKDLQAKDEAMKTTIKMALIEQANTGDGVIKTTAGGYKISYTASERNSVDTNALKKAGLFEKYAKKSEVYTLRFSQIKE